MANINIRRRKIKAIYYNSFYCPECSLELHQGESLMTYPPQHVYYCINCGFKTTSFQKPGFEYEFEEDENV